MKTLLLFCSIMLGFVHYASAQDDDNQKKLEYGNKTKNADVQKEVKDAADSLKPWKLGVISSVTFSQTAMYNWAAGGQNNIALLGTLGLFANFEKNRHYWFSLIDASYGGTLIEKMPWRKTQDYWEFNTRYGYKFKKQWSVTAFAEALSQFAYGYDYANDPTGSKRTSSIFAPGFLNQGLGIGFDAPKAGISMLLSPITAREIFVLDQAIDPIAYIADPSLPGVLNGGRVQVKVGASLRVNFFMELWKKRIAIESRLFSFMNYMQEPEQIMVNWRTKVDIKILKVLSLNLLVHLIYDPSVMFPKTTITNPDGSTTVTERERRLQIMQMLGIGLGYTLVGRR